MWGFGVYMCSNGKNSTRAIRSLHYFLLLHNEVYDGCDTEGAGGSLMAGQHEAVLRNSRSWGAEMTSPSSRMRRDMPAYYVAVIAAICPIFFGTTVFGACTTTATVSIEESDSPSSQLGIRFLRETMIDGESLTVLNRWNASIAARRCLRFRVCRLHTYHARSENTWSWSNELLGQIGFRAPNQYRLTLHEQRLKESSVVRTLHRPLRWEYDGRTLDTSQDGKHSRIEMPEKEARLDYMPVEWLFELAPEELLRRYHVWVSLASVDSGTFGFNSHERTVYVVTASPRIAADFYQILVVVDAITFLPIHMGVYRFDEVFLYQFEFDDELKARTPTRLLEDDMCTARFSLRPRHRFSKCRARRAGRCLFQRRTKRITEPGGDEGAR
jgi:hypothetical protein